jgi:ribose 5-phosphate isomerase B
VHVKIIIGSDHVGYPLKQAVLEYLEAEGIEVEDAGADNAEESVHYPDYAREVSLAVSGGAFEYGILICGTGLGMSMAANKYAGVRAALCENTFSAYYSRAHNNANVLCMGSRVVTPAKAEWILKTWLETPFDYGRHVIRVEMLDQPLNQDQEPKRPAPPQNWNSVKDLAVALSPTKSAFGPLLYAGDLESGPRAAAESGFTAVELSLRKPGDMTATQLEELLGAHHLSLSAIATGQSCLHDQFCLSTSDEEVRRRTVERLAEHIKMGARFNAPVIIGGIRGALAGSEEERKRQRFMAIESMRECTELADSLGSLLLLEPINRYETNFVNSAEDGLELIEEVGRPNLKLLLDSFHMNIEDANMAEAIEKAGDHLGYIHFADSNRQAPGRGHIDFDVILRALARINYSGVMAVEILPLPDDSRAMQEAGAFLRSKIDPQKVEKQQ